MKAAIAMEVDEQLPNGSIVHWSEKRGQIVPVTCGLCEIRRPLKVKSVNQLKRFGTFTGYHNHCRILKHNKDLAKDGVEHHPSGALIYWKWEDRDPEDPTHRVAVLCSNKDRCVTPGEKSFINRHVVESSPNWSGRCSACVERDGLPQRRTDPGVDTVLISGSTIHWSERTTNTVPVTCGYPLGDSICGHKREVTVYTVRSEHHTYKPAIYTGYCKTHYWDEVRALRARRVNNTQNGNLAITPSNGKRPRGRRAGVKYIDPQASRASLESAVEKLWTQFRSMSAITFPAVATIFQSAGERVGADAVKKRFYDLETGMKWRDFVLFVVSEKGNLNQRN